MSANVVAVVVHMLTKKKSMNDSVDGIQDIVLDEYDLSWLFW